MQSRISHRLIAIEGLDLAGKTITATVLAARLSAKYVATPLQPLSSVRYSFDEVSSDGRFLFYLASVIHASDQIRQYLLSGDVVCDRYVYSTIAYHRALGVNTEIVKWEDLAIVRPVLAVYLTATQESRRGRMSGRRVVTDEDKSERLQRAVEKEFERMGLLRVDTTNLSVDDVVSLIQDALTSRSWRPERATN